MCNMVWNKKYHYTTLDLDEFLSVSYCETTSEMWDILQITHEGNIEVNGARLDTLVYEYGIFRMKPEENIN